MTTYTVKAVRSGDWWALSVPEVPGVHTQARKLSGAKAMAHDAIALMLDVDPDSFKVKLDPDLPAEIVATIQEARTHARQAAELRDLAALSARASVQALLESGMTKAEAAAVLELSPQRMSQLAPGAVSHVGFSSKKAATVRKRAPIKGPRPAKSLAGVRTK